MGVKGLWPLLEPVGRRIHIEALRNKKLAVDASIWLFQFIQAMRDERGEPLRNAHVLGFFRRICRLLFHRIRPVFVFDGATPALKRQTTAARRRRREQQHAKLRKTAEKLLMNQLKQHALSKVTEAQLKRAAAGGGAPPAAANGSTASADAEQLQEQQQLSDHEQQIAEVVDLVDGDEEDEAAAAAADRARKGKAPIADDDVDAAGDLFEAPPAARRPAPVGSGPSTSAAAAATAAAAAAGSTAADELLAAQMAAAGWATGDDAAAAAQAAQAGALSAFLSRSQERQQQQRRREQAGSASASSDEEDLEIVVPEGQRLDPEVLSRLPPSLAMQLMDAERERQRAANRAALEERAAAPAHFSQFQMQQYLAATKFRRQVEEVKDAINTAAAGGSAARRIAGEVGREYVLHREEGGQEQGAQTAAAAQQQQAAAAPGLAPAAVQTATQHASAAADAGEGGGGGVLDIEFDVAAGQDWSEASADDELGWEDVEAAEGPAGGSTPQGQHWRQRAAARQRYWSVSHGFQMGRKLAAWGEQAGQEEGGPAPEAGAELADAEPAVPDPAQAAAAPAATPPSKRKALIARSASPIRPVPEDEDGQLQEAIRRSLADPGSGSKQGPGQQASGVSGVSGDGASPAAALVSPAAAADRLLQRRRELRWRLHPEEAAAVEAATEVGASAVAVDVASAAGQAQQAQAGQAPQPSPNPASAPANGATAPTAGLGQASRGGSSGSDADWLWEEVEAAGGGGEGAGGAALLSSINRSSTQRLEELVGPRGAASPDQQQQQQPQGVGLPDAVVEGQSDDGMTWEAVSLPGRQGGAAAEAGPWQQEAAGIEAAAAAGGQRGASDLGVQQGGEQAGEGKAGEGLAAVVGRAEQAADRQRARPPLPAPALAEPGSGGPAKKRVRFGGATHAAAAQREAQPTAPAVREAPPAHLASPPAAAPALGAGRGEAAADAATPPRAAGGVPSAGEPSIGGFSPAELEQLAALEDDEDAWEDVLSPPPSQPSSQPAGGSPAGGGPSEGRQGASAAAAPPPDFEAQLEALQAEEKRLRASQRAGRGQVETPTADMYQDCMELLTMFGLPYIIAPQEAEAQCAWLDEAGLVDGVVTDDNDVFLFGARRVYRHIFESKRYVEEYRCEDVQRELGVGREQLAQLAQLLGSDYCEGVAGVGIVNAVEVVHAFPGPQGLQAFRDWLTAPDEQLVQLARGKGGSRGRGRGRGQQQAQAGAEGGAEGGASGSQDGPGGSQDGPQAALMAEFKHKHRGVKRNWEPPPGFPSDAVAQAYAQPRVDTSKDKFSFGCPDVELLRRFCAERFGWSEAQAEELLGPVAAAYEQRQSQATLDSFLTMRQRFAKIKSKRLQRAVVGIAGREHTEIMLQEEDGKEQDAAGGGRPTSGGGSNGGARRKRSAAARGDAQGSADGGRPAGSEPKRRRQNSAPARGQGRGAGCGRGSGGTDSRTGVQPAGAEEAGQGLGLPAAPERAPQEDRTAAPAAPAGRQPRRGKRSVAVVKYAEPASGDEAAAED